MQRINKQTDKTDGLENPIHAGRHIRRACMHACTPNMSAGVGNNNNSSITSIITIVLLVLLVLLVYCFTGRGSCSSHHSTVDTDSIFSVFTDANM